MGTRDGYSHGFLESHTQNSEKQINKISKSKQNKETMKAKWEIIDMNFPRKSYTKFGETNQ